MMNRSRWSALARQLDPYVPGEQPRFEKLIKLNTNENPWPPSPRVLDVLRNFDHDTLRLYPDPEMVRLRTALAAHHQLEVDQVYAGNSSDELLAFAFRAFFDGFEAEALTGKAAAPILFPDLTYSFYPVYCQLYGIPFQRVPLNDDFEIDPATYNQPAAGVVLANPNAPTGIQLPLPALERLLRHHPDGVVIVDEAYVDFGGTSAVSLLAKYPQLLIVQTFSKSRALAGLRVGFALGAPELIAAIAAVKNSFNSYPLDQLAQAVACAALTDDAYFKQKCHDLIQIREATASALRQMGFHVLPSSTNFLLARHPIFSGGELMRRLRADGILVRHFNMPRITEYLRITIGTADEMKQFLDLLNVICQEDHPAGGSGEEETQ